jgi:hypothetical protein
MCFKKMSAWGTKKIQKLNCSDMQLIKLSVIGFTLMVAKLWEPILVLEWYWYALIFVLAAIKPMMKVFQ